MALTLTGFSHVNLSDAGGVLVEIYGTFVINHRYRARIGNTLMSIDPAFHSGIPGRGGILYPFTTGILRAYSPYMRPSAGAGIPYSVVVTDLETAEQDLLLEVANVWPRLYADSTYSLRKVLPLHYLTGARDIGLEKD